MTPLFDIDGDPSDPLIRLLDVCEVQHDSSLVSIRDATQAAWYQEGKLRSEILEGEHGPNRHLIIPLLQELGMIEALRAPVGSRWDYALLLGAMLTGVRKRLAHLEQLWLRGMRFRQLVMLGSRRPLNKDKEGASSLFDRHNKDLAVRDGWQAPKTVPTNEVEMMALLQDQAQLIWRGEVEVSIVDTPPPSGRNTDTRDTVRHWLTSNPTPGKCLVVSSQPFSQYQGMVVQSCLPPGFAPEDGVVAVGYRAPDSITVSAHLDSVAKTIFEIAKARGV